MKSWPVGMVNVSDVKKAVADPAVATVPGPAQDLLLQLARTVDGTSYIDQPPDGAVLVFLDQPDPTFGGIA